MSEPVGQVKALQEELRRRDEQQLRDENQRKDERLESEQRLKELMDEIQRLKDQVASLMMGTNADGSSC